MKLPLRLLSTTLLLAAGQAFSQGLTTVTIGWGAYPDVPQLAQASVKGLWAEEKLEARIIPFASGRQGFEALIGGQLDYAIMAEFPAVTGVMRNQKFSVVAVLSQYKSFRVITKGDKAPAGLAALAGKKIAMPLGTNVHFAIATALEKGGVNAELVNVPPSEMIPALTRGDVDAIMPFPSAYQKAKSVLGAQYQEIRTPDYSSSFVLAASEKATANPALTQRVLAALLKGEALSRPTRPSRSRQRHVTWAAPPRWRRSAPPGRSMSTGSSWTRTCSTPWSRKASGCAPRAWSRRVTRPRRCTANGWRANR